MKTKNYQLNRSVGVNNLIPVPIYDFFENLGTYTCLSYWTYGLCYGYIEYRQRYVVEKYSNCYTYNFL